MIESYEQLIVTNYLLRLITDCHLSPQVLVEICEFLERDSAFLGLELCDEEFLERLDEFQGAVREKTGIRKAYRKTISAIEAKLTDHLAELKGSLLSALESNLVILADELDLDPVERGFFGLLVRYLTHDNFQRIFNELTRQHLSLLEVCAICLGTDRHTLNEKLRQNSRLISSGIVCQPGRNGNDLDDNFEIPDAVRTGMQKACGVKEDIRRYILGEPAIASLHWDDFDHLGETPARLARYLKTAIENQIPGVNILLWGPPGTGKTEFCKTLAEHLDVKLYPIGEKDEDGKEPCRKERIEYLQLAQSLLRYQSQSLLLFDEMDDLFEGSVMARLFGGKLSSGSKVFTNRLFEKNPIPTIWTINDAKLLDEAVVRRMSLAIELTIPPVKAREKVWKRVLKKNALTLTSSDIKELAQLDISPAVVVNAAQFAKQIGGGIDDFRFAARGIVKAMSGQNPKNKVTDTTAFCKDLIRTETDLDRISRQLKKTRRRDFSLCLYGPPGTGKSAFVRHLAQTLEMPVLFKRASDLMDAYVGETEKCIAAAFQEALDKDAFLVFDEADSLLGDRRYAARNWEVSQVNEMLTWMESHPLPFACTTNLMDRLDQASLRRFTFKCHFDYLSDEQINLAFQTFFDLPAPKNQVGQLKGLTPGDFALVSKKARIIGCEKSTDELVDLLKEELAAKEYRPTKQLGFGRG